MNKFIIQTLLVIFGFLTISSQTVLFREFLLAFNGNELGIAAFFSAWTLWVFCGALVSKKIKLANAIPWLILYIPLFAIQWTLIFYIKSLAGVDFYEFFPLGKLVFFSFLLNSPISFFTGFIFAPLAKSLSSLEKQNTVGRLYSLEAVGGLIAGLAVTLLLNYGVTGIKIYSLSALLLLIALIFYAVAEKKYILLTIILIFLIGPITSLFYFDTKTLYTLKKDKVLRASSYINAFSSQAGELIHTKREKQDVLIYNGTVTEVFPNKEYNGMVAANLLAQNPQAKSILIIGAKAGLVNMLTKHSKNINIYLYFPDPLYYQYIFDKILPNYKQVNQVHIIHHDPVSYVLDNKVKLDAVAFLTGDPTTSVQNRFFTVDFLQGLSNYLADHAILLFEISGQENYSGQERSNFGISIYQTLKHVFGKIIIKPGESTFLIVSKGRGITDNPKALKQRFKSINNHKTIFPADGFFTLYQEERIKYSKNIYENRLSLPSSSYINKKEKPVSYLFSLLLLGKYTKSPVTMLLKNLHYIDQTFIFSIFIIALLFYFIYQRYSSNLIINYTFETVLTFIVGMNGMILNIALIYDFQSVFGSVFLYIGLISALFMGGVFVGSVLPQFLIKIKTVIILLSLVISSLFTSYLALFSLPSNLILYFTFFLLAGLITGFFFPLCSLLLKEKKISIQVASSSLEASDHLGATFGGAITGLILIPSIGIKSTLFFCSLGFLLLLLLFLISNYTKTSRKIESPTLKWGILLLWLIVCLSIFNKYIDYKKNTLFENIQYEDLQRLGITSDWKISKKENYFEVIHPKKGPSFVFSSQNFASTVHGFGGPIKLIIQLSPEGLIQDFFVKESNETPQYFQPVLKWAQKLKGKNALHLKDIDALTGATTSSQALLQSIGLTAQNGLSQAKIVPSTFYEIKTKTSQIKYIYLVLAIIISLIMMKNKNIILRYICLIVHFVIGGILLNLQYSTDQIYSLLLLNMWSDPSNFVWCMVIVIPILVIIFGNFYCGFMCPFGALQEIIQLSPFSKPINDIKAVYKAQKIKYIVFFLAISILLLFKDKELLSFDPLVSFFHWKFSNLLLLITSTVILLAIFYPRFWCRYLCPAGAFLSMLSFFKPLNFLFPPKKYNQCDYQVKNKLQIDCIECNRCLRK